MKFIVRLSAVTNTMKKEITQQFTKYEGFPTDPDEIDKLLKHLDSLVPQNPKTKLYVQYLCSQMFEVTPPGFIINEDETDARLIMFAFDKLCTQGKLSGEDSNLRAYKTLADLGAKIDSLKAPKVQKEETSDYHSQYSEEQKKMIAAGGKVVYNSNGWIAWRCVGTQEGKNAARTLCNNELNDVKWCVGRGVTSYLDQGPFFILEYQGYSAYAISTILRGYSPQATIWNRFDAPVWITSTKEDSGFASLKAANANLDMTKISSLPVQIIPVLQAVCTDDKELASMIPSTNFKTDQGSTKELDKAIMAADKLAFSKELNNSFTSQRTLGLGSAVMSRCIALHYDLDWASLSENSLLAFIELYAGTGEKSLSPGFKSLEAYILSELQKKD